MHHTTFSVKKGASVLDLKSNLKKLMFIIFVTQTQLSAISSNMSHRTMSASPLLYKMIDYSQQQNCYEIEPIYMSMYDQTHTMANLMPNGKQTLQFSQLGTGDINPAWFNLMSNNTLANYSSQVTFTPSLTQSGALFHWYDQFDTMFLELKTALVQCKSDITITEIGGGNGLNPGILNAQQAFTQSDWNYGKIGQAHHVVGLDDIELRIGGIYKATSTASTYDLLFSGFAIIQAPTGIGTQAEWLFEPQVGTNHWNLGLGFESLISSDDNFKFMIGANYRYAIPAWETRSFDLLNCGQWSRYLGLQDTYGLPTAPATLTLPGINYLTQQAYINGRSQCNFYTRLQKHFRNNYFELSYNFLCIQKETIGSIKNMPQGFGIYAMTGETTGAGGVTTAPSATINENITALDSVGHPQTLSTANFDKQSACATTYASNNLTARLEIKNKNVIYGFGASIDAALSASALSTWSVWAQFGLLFGSDYKDDDLDGITPSQLYDYDQKAHTIISHDNTMNDAQLPDETVQTIEDDFIKNTDIFEYADQEVEKLDIKAPEIISFENNLYELNNENGILLIDLENQEIQSELEKNPLEHAGHNGLAMPTLHEQLLDAINNDQTVDMNNYEIIPKIKDGLSIDTESLHHGASITKS